MGQGSSIGAVATLRSGGDYHNNVAGIDGDIHLGKSDRLRFHFVGSDTRYPAAFARNYEQKTGSFGGTAARSASEAGAVSQAGGARAQAGIRSEVGDPATTVVDKGSTTRDIIVAPEGPGQDATASTPR